MTFEAIFMKITYSTTTKLRLLSLRIVKCYFSEMDPTLKTMKINLYFLVSHSLLYMGGIK